MFTQEKAINNLDRVITKIEHARLQVSDHHIVQLVAISKYHTSEEILTLYKGGQRAFGENKVQDLRDKQKQLEEYPIAWHFVGTLQKNKINQLIDANPVLFHSLDSIELAIELDKKLKQKNKKMRALLQVNSAYEDTKSGFHPQEAIEAYKKITENYTNIELIGMMSIGAHSDDHAKIKESFQTTKILLDQIDPKGLCSMGMSGDFEEAIRCGSTIVRIGSALFE